MRSPAAATATEAVDPDVVESLGDEIATLSAHIDSATCRLLVLIGEFDRLRGWELAGYQNCARWLAMRTGIDIATAREKVRVARALENLPLTRAAMARGELSFSKVRALTRVATPANEAELLELAQGSTTAQVERMARAFRKGSRKDEAEWERERHRARTFSVFPDDDGMYLMRGRVTAEVGALFMRAVEAASDALYQERGLPGLEDSERAAAQLRADAVGLLAERALAAGFGGRSCGCGGGEAREAEACEAPGDEGRGAHGVVGAAEERGTPGEGDAPATDGRTMGAAEETAVADTAAGAAVEESAEGAAVEESAEGAAVEESAEGAAVEESAGGATVEESAEEAAEEAAVEPPVEESAEELAVEAGEETAAGHGAGGTSQASGSCTCPAHDVPISGTRAERYQVLLHVQPSTLAAEGEPGLSELEDGTRVSAETSRRLACDASVVRVVRGEDGPVLDVGRKTRTIPPALRRALEIRDRGCRFPGCGLRFTDAHHVIHWADEGETSLNNCLLLCRHHHRLVHEGGWSVEWWGAGKPAFHDPRGVTHFDGRWQPPQLPARPVEALLRENRQSGARPGAWTAAVRWEREADVPDEVYFRAWEAL